MISYEKAKELVMSKARLLGLQTIRIQEALGRVVARTVRAGLSLPPFTNSAVDGYAIRSEDTIGACQERAGVSARLRLLAEQSAGNFFNGTVPKGTALKIMTGAALPRGTDAIVPKEEVEEGQGYIEIKRKIKKGENVRLAGEDLKKGQDIIQRGTVLRLPHLGMLAACGYRQVTVYRSPRVAVFVTGNELAPPGRPLRPGMIYDSNSTLLQALVRTTGADLVAVKRIRDNLKSLRAAFQWACNKSDIIITSGGVSVGDYDLVKAAAAEVKAHLVFWQVAQKPGKPLAFYTLNRAKRHVYLFGLPGNPGAVLICFEEYIRPFIKKMIGWKEYEPRIIEAILTHDIKKKKGRLNFWRVKLQMEAGQWLATSAGPQESGIISSFAETQGLALIPAACDYLPAGSKVKVHLLEW
ncbi:MAG: molybdopterin molybdotransferase MoeA [Candidatus Aminicenantales bacterium]